MEFVRANAKIYSKIKFRVKIKFFFNKLGNVRYYLVLVKRLKYLILLIFILRL